MSVLGQKDLADLLTNQQHEEEIQADRTYEESRGRNDKGRGYPGRVRGVGTLFEPSDSGRSTNVSDQERSW
jgi:hypothetical protein